MLKRLQSYFKAIPEESSGISCVGKAPFYAEFIRFQIITLEAQQFASWVANLYKNFLSPLSLCHQPWGSAFPIQFLWKNSDKRFVWGTILGSRDSKGRDYPLGIARWSLNPFSVSFYECLADLDFHQFLHQSDFEQSLHALGLVTGGVNSAVLIKELEVDQPLFYQLIEVFKSWAVRLNSMPAYQGVEIPLPKNSAYRTQLSLIQFWIQLTERLLLTVKWQHIYWHKDRLLISFIPLSEGSLVAWILQQKTVEKWISLSDKVAVDVSVQKTLQRQLKESPRHLTELLSKLS